MGLFDNVFGGSNSPKELTKEEAYMGILMAANASDGHLSDEEELGFVTIVSRMRMYEPWSGDKIRRTLDKMLGMIKRKGAENTMKACARVLPQKYHKAVFANAVDLVLADGVVEDEEKEFINDLRTALELSGDDAQMIAQVMVWKNQG